MNLILSVAIVVSLSTSLLLIIRFGKKRLTGTDPMPLMAFLAILFTSGLDVGLIMFPLTEFPVYQADDVYGFTNALAVEFGFWGFLVWAFYFLTTFYFCVVEPKTQIFEIRWVKFINSAVIIATCAFTGFLFLSYLPDYIVGISDPARYLLVAVVVFLAVLSSTDIRYVKWLGISSSVLFFCLIALLWLSSGAGVLGWIASLSQIGGYFANLPRFMHPMSDYHAFYLFWWFAWSIMIGQFVARFVNGLRAYQLLTVLLVIPSILIALWFSVLYIYHSRVIMLSDELQFCMVVVGIIFVMNSLDSLTRLYSENLGLTVRRLGGAGYVGLHWALLFGLVLLYQFTPLKIEWIGLVVIGLYCAVYVLTFIRRDVLIQQTE